MFILHFRLFLGKNPDLGFPSLLENHFGTNPMHYNGPFDRLISGKRLSIHVLPEKAIVVKRDTLLFFHFPTSFPHSGTPIRSKQTIAIYDGACLSMSLYCCSYPKIMMSSVAEEMDINPDDPTEKTSLQQQVSY